MIIGGNDMRLFKRKLFFTAMILILMMMTACGEDANSTNKDVSENDTKDEKFKIGLSVVDLSLERWQHDRDMFTERAEELGAEVIVQSADGDADKQLSTIQNMLSQEIDVLVVIAANSDALAPVIEQANEQNVPVVA